MSAGRSATAVDGRTAALAAFPIVAVALFRLAPTPPPRVPIAPSSAVPLGLLVGALVFVGLAGRLSQRSIRPGALGVGLSLAVAGASEEAIWRGFALPRIAASLGLGFALVATTVGFAISHFPALRTRGVLVHLATGAVFGALYAASGSLAAVATAHALYNLLAVVSRQEVQPACAVQLSTGQVAALRGVAKRYGPVTALDDVDLAFREGGVTALLGPNGAGKTTLVGLLLGLRRPDRGTVTLFGRDPRSRRARALVGVTPQEMSFPPTLRAVEVLDFARRHYAAPAPRAQLLEDFELVELARRQLGGLSAGQRRRLAVAAAFAGRPRFVVLDEPTAGLDVESRRGVWDTLRRYAAAGGTVLLTTHHLEEADALADRVVVLSRGAVVADGTPASLTQAGTTLEAAYLQLTRETS